MALPNELKAHERWKGYLPSMESRIKFYEVHLNSKGNFSQMESLGKLGKGFGITFQVSLGLKRGFKILPSNDAKMLFHNL
jgi:hypothetical protein